ncbi:MAG: cyclic nucleotide-binding domain-containing protein [Acidimicrobiales bacterium]
MRIHSRVTAVSWIPSEAVSGAASRAAFATLGHYDDPLPDRIGGDTTAEQGRTLDAWREADRYRFANQLGAWIDVDSAGAVVAAGYDGGVRIGSTRLTAGSHGVAFEAMAMPLLQAEPEIGPGPSARFVQTWGGRTGVPAPRRVNRPPFLQFRAPLAWSTLALTIHADGRSEFEVVGASRFPRHWIYGTDGSLAAKTGTTDYKHWYRYAFGRHTPWGDTDTAAFVTAAESALERQLSTTIMRGGRRPTVRRLAPGSLLTEQGAAVGAGGAELYLVLDGVLRVEVDGEALAEIGPGAVVGERAVLEGGVRTSTLRAVTRCRVAVAAAADVDHDALAALSAGHRREHAAP